jgi:hypothetical protein
MPRRIWRDLFISHTKSIKLDKSVVDMLAGVLATAGFSIWGYADWDWLEKRKQEPSWQDDLSRDGFLLDPSRAFGGDPPIKPQEVDRDKLDELISHSRAVLFVHPSRGSLSSGMKEELYSLRRDRQRYYRKEPVPVVCWCSFESNKRDPIPLGFGDGRKIIDDWRAFFPLRLEGSNICGETLIHISVVITKLLLEQRLAHVAEKSETDDSENGWRRVEFSDFDLTPDEELQRSKTVLNLARAYKNPSRDLKGIINILKERINGIRPNDLNDGHSIW